MSLHTQENNNIQLFKKKKKLIQITNTDWLSTFHYSLINVKVFVGLTAQYFHAHAFAVQPANKTSKGHMQV